MLLWAVAAAAGAGEPDGGLPPNPCAAKGAPVKAEVTPLFYRAQKVFVPAPGPKDRKLPWARGCSVDTELGAYWYTEVKVLASAKDFAQYFGCPKQARLGFNFHQQRAVVLAQHESPTVVHVEETDAAVLVRFSRTRWSGGVAPPALPSLLVTFPASPKPAVACDDSLRPPAPAQPPVP